MLMQPAKKKCRAGGRNLKPPPAFWGEETNKTMNSINFAANKISQQLEKNNQYQQNRINYEKKQVLYEKIIILKQLKSG